MEQQHLKKDLKTYIKGANSDKDAEFVGANQSGQYIDAHNFHHPADGNDGDLEKIGGETLTYDLVQNSCINPTGVSLSLNYRSLWKGNFFLTNDNEQHQIDFICDSAKTEVPLIVIDGRIVLQSAKLPFTTDNPLQARINENAAQGAEIYVTDNAHTPLIFSITDLMVNGGMIPDTAGNIVCTDKYFGSFEIEPYTLELSGSNNHPVIIGEVPNQPAGTIQFGNGGLKVGKYQLAVRYSTTDGDKSGWSVDTPLFPIVAGYSSDSTIYPYTKTFGAVGGTTSPFGIWFVLRVDNQANYDYLEFKLTKYNSGSPIGVEGVQKLLDYRLDLADGDLYVQEFFYKGGLELDLTTDEQIQSNFSAIDTAKSLRYVNQRLHLFNIKYKSRNIETKVSFIETASGKEMYPIVKNLKTAGHKNPYNACYFPSLATGEKYGFAFLARDSNNQSTFALPIPASSTGETYDNYQMPNRRDPAAAETIALSQPVFAADVNGVVHRTHEVFNNENNVAKTGGELINIIDAGVFPSGYITFHPTQQSDGLVTGHNDKINDVVYTGTIDGDQPYNPFGFAPVYQAIGMALQGVSSIPSYIKSFSVVRTKRANRVVAQGLAYYDMSNPSGNEADIQKATNTMRFFSPDISSGIVDFQNVIEDIIVNGVSSRYKLQCVSPVGFFTEAFNKNKYDAFIGEWGITQNIDSAVDMVNYCRILREAGTINVKDDPSNDGTSTGVGIDNPTPDGFGYTGYNKWRLRSLPGGGTFPAAGNGNQIFDISAIIPLLGSPDYNERQTTLFRIATVQNVYQTASTGIADAIANTRNFDIASVQQWHEPMYIVNIIDTQAEVVFGNISEYIEGGHFQKTDATIGKIVGITKQTFPLVDERAEDAIPSAFNPTGNKLIFIRRTDGIVEAWINKANQGGLAALLNSIIAGLTVNFNGQPVKVKGVYDSTSAIITTVYTQYSIVFDPAFNPNTAIYQNSLFVPVDGSLVVVKYDSQEPLQAYIGDVETHESVFSPYDIKGSADGGVAGSKFYLPVAFPYKEMDITFPIARDVTGAPTPYELSQRLHFVEADGGTPRPSRIRQIITMFPCEARTSLPFLYETPSFSLNKYFPATFYIPRPFIYNPALLPTAQVVPIFAQYNADYPLEQALWGYGGFRHLPNNNIDYSKEEETDRAFSKPKVGFTEQLWFPTRDLWTAQRPINIIDAPGVRTFPSTNFDDLSDDTGEGKYLYDDYTEGKGANLYAFTEHGLCLLITDKTLLYEATGQQLSAIGNSGSNLILQQLWISKTIGMSDQNWQLAAEGYNVNENGIRIPAIFFTNKISSYRFANNTIVDIAKESDYQQRLRTGFINLIQKGFITKQCSWYDLLHDEYNVFIGSQGDSEPFHASFCFDETEKSYVGSADWNYDKVTSFNNQTFGSRNGRTYELNSGSFILNDLPVNIKVAQASSMDQVSSKEFVRIRIPSNIKPTTVEFYSSKESYLTGVPEAIIDATLPNGLKNYGAFEQYIPRKILAPKFRMQGRLLIFVIKEVSNQKFRLVDTLTSYKILK